MDRRVVTILEEMACKKERSYDAHYLCALALALANAIPIFRRKNLH